MVDATWCNYAIVLGDNTGEYENWFVIARSEEHAAEFHECSEGFNPGFAKAKYLCDIPPEIVGIHHIVEAEWPSYQLLEDLGGKINSRENPRIVNFNGAIYEEGTFSESMFYDGIGPVPGVYVIKIQNTENTK